MNHEEDEGGSDQAPPASKRRATAAPINIGPPPDTEAIAELLGERYPLRPGETVAVSVRTDPLPGLHLALSSGRERYEISVDFLRGAKGRDPWMLIADALDALFGTLLESNRAYRDLPRGDEVEYEGAFFRVEVQRVIPELVEAATRLLGDDS